MSVGWWGETGSVWSGWVVGWPGRGLVVGARKRPVGDRSVRKRGWGRGMWFDAGLLKTPVRLTTNGFTGGVDRKAGGSGTVGVRMTWGWCGQSVYGWSGVGSASTGRRAGHRPAPTKDGDGDEDGGRREGGIPRGTVEMTREDGRVRDHAPTPEGCTADGGDGGGEEDPSLPDRVRDRLCPLPKVRD